MNTILKNFFYPFLLPNGLLCTLVLIGLSWGPLPDEVRPFLNVFPYAVVVTGLLLGWRFNRTRLIYAICLLLLTELGLLYFNRGERAALAFQMATLLLPFNLLLVSWFRERGLLNLRSAGWLLIVLVELFGCGWVLSSQSKLAKLYLNYPLLDLSYLPDLPLSQPLLIANLFILLLLAWRLYFRMAAFEASFFWAQLILMAGFSGLGVHSLRLYLASSAMILIIGIMESSHSLAYRDELTGLPGRRSLNEAMAKLGSRFTLAMLDIDHFKKFNDTHGHDVGDQVLKMVASKLANVKGGGKVFRYGGEEFSVVFPRKSVKEALPFLETLRQTVEDARFIPRGKDRPKKKPKKRTAGAQKRVSALRVTISIGGAERDNDHNTADAVIKAADRALYRAKKAGRNRVCS